MSLTKKTLRNMGVVGLLEIFNKVFNSITLIILARLLLPSDFGIVAIAGILISIVDRFKDFGISNAIIQIKHNTDEALQKGSTVRLMISILFFGLVYIFPSYYLAIPL